MGLGWLNSHKEATRETPAYTCQLSWDWQGDATLTSRIDYQLTCTAKVDLQLSDFFVNSSSQTRYTNVSGPGGKYTTGAGAQNLSAQGPISLKAGQVYQHQGQLNVIRPRASDKQSSTRTQLVAQARISYSASAPVFPEGEDSQQLFVYTGVY